MNIALAFFFCIYVLAIPTSLGIMEIASWTVCLLGIVKYYSSKDKPQLTFPLGTWGLSALALVVLTSAVANGLSLERTLASIGKFRFIFLYLFLHNIVVLYVEPKTIYKFSLWALPFVLLTSIYAFVQYYTGFDFLRGDDFYFPPAVFADGEAIRWRSIGWFNMPFTYGYVFSGIAIMLICHLYFQAQKKITSLFYFELITLGIVLLSLVTTYTRGVWLALFAALFVTLFILKKTHLVGFLLVTIISVGGYMAVDKNFSQRLTWKDGHSHQSNSERLAIWRMNLAMFMDNPVVGVGFDENSYLIKEYFKKYEITDVPASHAHSTYLNFLSGLGILGLLAFLTYMGALCLRAIKGLWEAPRGQEYFFLSAAFLGVIVVIAVGGLTECNFKDAEVNHFFVLTSALFSGVTTRLDA